MALNIRVLVSYLLDHDNGGQSKQKSSVSDLCDSAEPSESAPSRPPETFRNQHTISRANTKQNQKLLKKKLEYRSNPNLTCECLYFHIIFCLFICLFLCC